MRSPPRTDVTHRCLSRPSSARWCTVLASALVFLLLGGACSRGDNAAAPGGTTIATIDEESVGTTEVPPEEGMQLFDYRPAVGDCFDRRRTTDGTSRSYILKFDCAKPHMFEVFAVVDLETSGYPGEVELATAAKKQCPRSWEAYVGQAYELSKLELSWEAPSSANWNLTLDHSLGCLLKAGTDNAKLEGSRKGSRE